MRYYTIGDIHGAYQELCWILEEIEKDVSNHHGEYKIIFMGDYVDRGFQSKQVLELLSSLDQDRHIFLLGNHDSMFLDWLGIDGHLAGQYFYMNGGGTTVLSYVADTILPHLSDVSTGRHKVPQVDLPDCDGLIELVPQSHITFLQSCLSYYQTDTHIWVHAGLNPFIKLEDNTLWDFLWVGDNRNAFFSRMKQVRYPKLMIHAHTMVEKNATKNHIKDSNRINVDTGAGRANWLTCCVVDTDIDPNDYRLIQVKYDRGNKRITHSL
jgi:serine/threonine protein phosphatase 1